MIYFFSYISVAQGDLKGHDRSRGSGPLTVDRPWEAAASKGRGWGILTSPLMDWPNQLDGPKCCMFMNLTLVHYLLINNYKVYNSLLVNVFRAPCTAHEESRISEYIQRGIAACVLGSVMDWHNIHSSDPYTMKGYDYLLQTFTKLYILTYSCTKINV